MNITDFLDAYCIEMREQVKDIILPVRPTKENLQPKSRAVDIYKMQLPNPRDAQERAPYIINQIMVTSDKQPAGQLDNSTAVIRSIFSVFNEDGQEGGLMLLTLMERMKIYMLKQRIINGRYELDMDSGIETIMYLEEKTAPFCAGEMVSVWKIPAVKREVDYG